MVGLVWASWLRRVSRMGITVWVSLRGRESFRDAGASKGVAKEGEKRREEVKGRKVARRWWKGRGREEASLQVKSHQGMRLPRLCRWTQGASERWPRSSR